MPISRAARVEERQTAQSSAGPGFPASHLDRWACIGGVSLIQHIPQRAARSAAYTSSPETMAMVILWQTTVSRPVQLLSSRQAELLLLSETLGRNIDSCRVRLLVARPVGRRCASLWVVGPHVSSLLQLWHQELDSVDKGARGDSTIASGTMRGCPVRR